MTDEIDDDAIDQESGTNSWWELKFKVEALEAALADARADLAARDELLKKLRSLIADRFYDGDEWLARIDALVKGGGDE